MTLDERMPFFILLSAIPFLGLWAYAQDTLKEIQVGPLTMALGLSLSCIPLYFADNMNRQQKTILSWNWVDALIMGFAQFLIFFPGAGRQLGFFTAAFLRNYQREAAAKFAFYSLLPVLTFLTSLQLREVDFSAAQAAPNLSWLSFSMACVLAFLCSLLAIGGLMKSLQLSGVKGYIRYRLVLTMGILAIYWLTKSS